MKLKVDNENIYLDNKKVGNLTNLIEIVAALELEEIEVRGKQLSDRQRAFLLSRLRLPRKSEPQIVITTYKLSTK